MIGPYNRLEEGRWSEGRPVFAREDGSLIDSVLDLFAIDQARFLIVAEGSTVWGIKRSTTDSGSYILSGRATNSPASPEAGPSVRDGVTRWRYANNGFKEGDISVTCR